MKKLASDRVLLLLNIFTVFADHLGPNAGRNQRVLAKMTLTYSVFPCILPKKGEVWTSLSTCHGSFHIRIELALPAE